MMNANSAIKMWFGKLRDHSPRRIEVAADQSEHFNGAGKSLRIVTGLAWVTVDKQDIVLKAGTTLKLPPHKCWVSISGLQKSPVIYEIW
jgi:hypothetical protein